MIGGGGGGARRSGILYFITNLYNVKSQLWSHLSSQFYDGLNLKVLTKTVIIRPVMKQYI